MVSYYLSFFVAMLAVSAVLTETTTFTTIHPSDLSNTQTTLIIGTESPIIGCPPSVSISPCTCGTSQQSVNNSLLNGLIVSCSSLNLNDSQLSTILSVFLSPQISSPVFQISASLNQLTYVSNQISKFTYLSNLDLSYNQITSVSSLDGLSFSSAVININLNNNQITSIPSGTFNFTLATSISIDISYNYITALSTNAFSFPSSAAIMNNLFLQRNQISTISPGAFQGNYSFVYLDNNNLTVFQSSVFQSVLNAMSADNGLLSIAGNSIDCLNNLCDLAWLIRDNSELLTNVMSGTCSNGTRFTSLNPLGFSSCDILTTTQSRTTSTQLLTSTTTRAPTTTPVPIIGCPPSVSISPCTCGTSQQSVNNSLLNGLIVSCSSLNLNDSQLSTILSVFLSPQISSPVFQISASLNQLTYVSNQISKFTYLSNLDLSYNQITSVSPLDGLSFSSAVIDIKLNNNQITSIPSDTFNFNLTTSITVDLSYNYISSLSTHAFTFPSSATIMNNLFLQRNQISTISPGAFQGNYSFVYLDNNNLTDFQSSVFQSVLNAMSAENGLLSIAGNAIDCSNNLCDLAWLIRDNSELLANVMSGTCSNGTRLANLNPLGFSSCDILTTTQHSTTQQTTTGVTTQSQTTSTQLLTSTTTRTPTTTPVPIIGCPPSASISPCTCSTSVVNAITGLNINCSALSLSDSQLNNVLGVFLSPQMISPIFSLSAPKNQLTYVPNQITKFALMTYLDLSYNQIVNISSLSASFLTAASISIYLTNNKITIIPSGSFNYPNTKSVGIQLGSNQISSINTNSFLFPAATSITIEFLSNQIASITSTMFNYPSATVINLGFFNNSVTAIPSGMLNYPLAKYFYTSFGNNQIALLPSNIFTCPLATFVSISLNSNKITSIPSGAFNYTYATSNLLINLASNNITTVPSNAFISPSASTSNSLIFLNSNQITAISPGAFQGNYRQIMLDNNKLVELKSDVFKLILNSIAGYNNSNSNHFASISANPIDCVANLCDLAWLIRDNRRLLTYVIGGKCSNGTAVAILNSLGFSSCVSTTTTSRPSTTSSTLRPVASSCPSSSSISPCTCTMTSYNTSRLNCNSQSLNDMQLSNILTAFLVPTSDIAPLVEIDACCNQLTQIPDQISMFTSLANLILYSNQITFIPTKAFKSSLSASIEIDLHSNNITVIPSGTFNFSSSTSVTINLSNNQITSIPTGVFVFPNATSIFIYLSYNQIVNMPPGLFNYPLATQIVIDLANNQITTLRSGIFLGKFKIINLNNNNLIRFDPNVFKPTLQTMLNNNASYISIGADPIDCSINTCDLAWLIRDNPLMLYHIQGGTCSNGTAFTDLNSFGYSTCLPTNC